MDYPPAVIDKAQRLAQLLQRVEAGETLETVCSELGMDIAAAELPRWQARYVAGDRRWEALLDGRFGHTHTIHSAMREWLYERKRQDPSLRAPALAAALSREFGVNVSAGHVNYLLRKVGLTSAPGRPYKTGAPSAPADAAAPDVGESTPVLANAGLFFPDGRPAGDGHPGGRGDRPAHGDPAVPDGPARLRLAGADQ